MPYDVTTNGSAKILTREDINRIAESRSDITYELVYVSAWQASVMIRVISGSDRSNYEAELMVQRGKDVHVNLRNAKVKLCALCLVDPTTKERLYSDQEVETLGRRSSAAIETIFDAAMALNGLDPQQVNKIAQGLEKNQAA